MIASPLFMLLALRALLAPRLKGRGGGAAGRGPGGRGVGVRRAGARLERDGRCARATSTARPGARCGRAARHDGARRRPGAGAPHRRLPRVGSSSRGHGQARRRPGGKVWEFQTPYDFDSVTPAELDRQAISDKGRSLAARGGSRTSAHRAGRALLPAVGARRGKRRRGGSYRRGGGARGEAQLLPGARAAASARADGVAARARAAGRSRTASDCQRLRAQRLGRWPLLELPRGRWRSSRCPTSPPSRCASWRAGWT